MHHCAGARKRSAGVPSRTSDDLDAEYSAFPRTSSSCPSYNAYFTEFEDLIKAYSSEVKSCLKDAYGAAEQSKKEQKSAEAMLLSTVSLLNSSHAGFLRHTGASSRQNGLTNLGAANHFYRLCHNQLLRFTTPISGVVDKSIMLKGSEIVAISGSCPRFIVHDFEGNEDVFICPSNEELHRWTEALSAICENLKRISANLKGDSKAVSKLNKAIVGTDVPRRIDPASFSRSAPPPTSKAAPPSPSVTPLLTLTRKYRQLAGDDYDKRMAKLLSLKANIERKAKVDESISVSIAMTSSPPSQPPAQHSRLIGELSKALDERNALKAEVASQSATHKQRVFFLNQRYDLLESKYVDLSTTRNPTLLKGGGLTRQNFFSEEDMSTILQELQGEIMQRTKADLDLASLKQTQDAQLQAFAREKQEFIDKIEKLEKLVSEERTKRVQLVNERLLLRINSSDSNTSD